MLPKTLIKGFDKRRLRNLLLLFFLALAIPTAVLIGQAYSQLKWEAFHQYRGLAEELTSRIDSRLIDMVNKADERSFTDYTFLVVAGDPSANLVQRSALSEIPVPADLPGTLGYFQVGSDGSFSTPALPSEGSDPEELGISRGEYSYRSDLAQQLQSVLADNRLVKSKSQPRLGISHSRPLAPASASPSPGSEVEEEKERLIEEITVQSSRQQAASEPEPAFEETYNRQAFDQLNLPRKDTPTDSPPMASGLAGILEMDENIGEASQDEQRSITGGKVDDLKLDSALQKKSEDAERSAFSSPSEPGRRNIARERAKKRVEQSALPEATDSINA
jgi:hypothetical protein